MIKWNKTSNKTKYLKISKYKGCSENKAFYKTTTDVGSTD